MHVMKKKQELLMHATKQEKIKDDEYKTYIVYTL